MRIDLRALALTLGLAAACHDEERQAFVAQPDPALGATRFVSAVGSGFGANGPPVSAPTDDRPDADGDGRTIEEGDIYRVLDGSRIVNLDAYRGLQIIDVADPAAPRIIGALRVSGSPVELYVQGTRAIVLMNDWLGYWGEGAELGKEQGGVVLLVDLSDPSAPVVVDRQVFAGYIQRSRLARGATTLLYVAASLWQLYDDGVTPVASGDRTIVRSLRVDDELELASELDLGGAVADIHARGDSLLVARTDWSAGSSQVAVVDLAEDGAMTLGADVAVAGRVKSQFGLDLRGDILRVVSEGTGETPTNHLETFDVSDRLAPIGVDHATFGAGESLFATLFVGDDKAFCVTYLRQDPFHAFTLDGSGHITPEVELVVSGWNDFFVTTFAETRLVGVGIDDASDGRRLAVSLYDITDLSAPEPLVARAHGELAQSWSEASFDHRAFSVLEDAVDIAAVDAPQVRETGLVLLPYSGWSETGYESGVRLFTFSPSTVSARGTLRHDTPVRRGFLADDETAACLSDFALSLHDVSDPDLPQALGEVALAPSYAGFEVYGDYGVRVVDTSAHAWWGEHEPAPNRAEVVALAGDPDSAPALAAFDLTPGATLAQVGSLAVSLGAQWRDDAWETSVVVWDLTDPLVPARRGELVTRDLPLTGGGVVWDVDRPAPAMDCYDCGGWRIAPRGTVVGQAMVFVEAVWESESVGVVERCVTSMPEFPRETSDTYYSGRVDCVRDGDGPATCSGAIYQCSGLDVTCVVVDDPSAIGASTTCGDEPVVRSWSRWVLHVLDLSAPAAPVLREPIVLPHGEEGVALLADQATLWVTSREPVDVADDVRGYVRYFVRALELSAPASAQLGTRVNVPGTLFAVAGADLYTIDQVYGADVVESAWSSRRTARSICG